MEAFFITNRGTSLLCHHHLLSFGFYVVVVVVLAFAIDAGEVEFAKVGGVETNAAADGVAGLKFEECVHTVVALVDIADIAVVIFIAVVVKEFNIYIQNLPS